MRRPSLYDANIALSRELDSSYDQIKAVADNVDELLAVNTALNDGTFSDVSTVVAEPLKSSIEAVAGISSDISIISQLGADVVTVAGKSVDISTVANNLTAVENVVNYIDEINEVGGAIGFITTIANNIDNVVEVGENTANINNLSGNIQAIIDVNDAVQSGALVAAETVAQEPFRSSVVAVGDNVANITSVAGNIDDIGTVATSIADVNTVAGDTVALNAVYDNLAEILLADDNATIATTKADEALSSATAAATSGSNAATSALNASTSEVNAANSASAASTSETNAGVSETNAANSALAASVSEGNASTSADAATTQAGIATSKAEEAATSAGNASMSEDSASNSANAAATSEANALGHATAANVDKIEWQGDWGAGLYDARDAVAYQGRSYIANKGTTETPGTAAADWDLLADKGVDGLGSGDMLEATYDPQGVAGDVFLRTNHTGEQAISTVTGLQTALDGKQETLVNQTNIKSINGNNLLSSGDLTIAAGSGGFSAALYFSDTTSTINGAYKQLSYIPDVAATTETIVCNAGETAGSVYLFELPIDTTVIDAGKWTANFYAQVDSDQGDTRIRYEAFMRAPGGGETTLFSATSQELNNGPEYVEFETTQPVFNVDATARYGIRLFANTTSNSDKTVTITVGDGNASYTNTPLATRHEQLRDRDKDDAHPISAITNLQTELNGKEPADADIVKAPGGVLPALDGSNLSNVSSVAGINDLTDVDTSTVVPNDGQALRWNNIDGEWQPGNVSTGTTFTKTEVTSANGQTVFGVSYTVGFLEVYRNGFKLRASDYTAANGTSVTLAVGANLDDEMEFVAWDTFEVANTYTAGQADVLLSGKADTGHTHVEADITDLDKYTQAEIDSQLAAKASVTYVDEQISANSANSATIDPIVAAIVFGG